MFCGVVDQASKSMPCLPIETQGTFSSSSAARLWTASPHGAFHFANEEQVSILRFSFRNLLLNQVLFSWSDVSNSVTLVESLQEKSALLWTSEDSSQQLCNCCSYKSSQLKPLWLFNRVTEAYTFLAGTEHTFNFHLFAERIIGVIRCHAVY